MHVVSILGRVKMKYCVIENTTKVIDGSENPIEIMLQNARNAGFAENEVEILTEEEIEEVKGFLGGKDGL